MKAAPLLAALILVAALTFLLWDRPIKLQERSSGEVSKPLVHAADEHYTTTDDASRDGTGKFYLGREIAKVMGHQAINWLERDNREAEEAPSKAISLLNLRDTDVLADIGAGSGYYTLRLAMQRPEGKVIAVDIQPEMIDFLENRVAQLGVENVETQLGKEDTTGLAPNSIDAALIVDAYHEFSHPYEMMCSIYEALRPGGRMFLLEYKAEDPNVAIKPLHKMTEAQARRELEYVGFRWVKTHADLPWQHLLVFQKP